MPQISFANNVTTIVGQPDEPFYAGPGTVVVYAADGDDIESGPGNDLIIAISGIINVAPDYYSTAQTAVMLPGTFSQTTAILNQSDQAQDLYDLVQAPGVTLQAPPEIALRFVDGTYGSLTASAVNVFYDLLLGHDPDPVSRGYWTQQLDNGQINDITLATNIMSSNEFAAQKGTLSDQAYVSLLYKNGTSGEDAGGAAFWLNSLQTESRGVVATQFATSSGLVSHASTWAPEPVTAEITALYEAGLGRAADPTGLGYWIGVANEGVPMAQIAQSIIASPEFVTDMSGHGSGNAGVVNTILAEAYRQNDPAAASFWTQALTIGATTQAGVVDA